MDTNQQDYDSSSGFRIKGKAKQKDAPQDTCVICLEPVTERAVAVPCNHLTFDFLCLCSWSQEQPSCPLCKTKITAIEYDWRSPTDCKVYHIPPPKEETHKPATRNTLLRVPRRPRPLPLPRELNPDAALAFRRRIYAEHNPCLHVGTNRVSQYQNFTPQSFATSTALQNRARMFMRRELQVFTFLQAKNTTTQFLIEYFVAMLKTTDIKDPHGSAADMVSEFLGRESAILFLHELEAWLRSPYERLENWDHHVQYAFKPPKRPQR